MMAAVAAGRSVKRRILALFMLCGLLPVAATILVSYQQVEDVLIAQRVALLRGAASNYATVLVDRLGGAERLARSFASGSSGRPARADALERHFRAAVAIEPAGPRVLFGAPSQVPTAEDIASSGRPLAADAGRVIVLRHAKAKPAVWIAVSENPATPSHRQLAFEIAPAYLWEAHDALPYLTEVCVLDAEGRPLECARQPPAAEFDAFRSDPEGVRQADFAWNAGDVRYLSGVRELFLGGRFGADVWVVIASQPEEYALAPIRGLASMVIPGVLLGMLVAVLLGLVHVRRTLQPLNELAQAARRVAVRDFDVRVTAARTDEFGVLGRSFNAMSARLGRQFKALEVQAEIDAVILSSADLARVVSIVMRRIAEVVSTDRCSLLLADPAGAYHLHSSEGQGIPADQEVDVSREERDRLRMAARGLRIARSEIGPSSVLAGIPGKSLYVLPFDVGDELGGAFILGYDEDRAPEDEEVSMVRKLGDRVAVALATARRDLELHRRAYYDSLTNLPNRLLGLEELTRAVAAAARHGRALAVLFVDLDGFSDVNDSLGHPAGDSVLAQSAARLRGCVRKSDFVARLGGDEFAIVLPELREAADAALVADHSIKALSVPIEMAEGRAHVSASVGIALYPDDGATAEELLKHADLAMYHAKEQGSGRTVFFEPTMNEEVMRRVELERELRRALDEQQLQVYYQPQLDLKTGRIVGAEALIRWIHPVRGLVPPAEFIGFAESSGLIDPIGQWALKAACAQFIAWRAEGLPVEYLSVNVSPRQFHTGGFSETVAGVLRTSGLPASALHLEITESALLGEQSAVRANLSGLNALGTPLELDDFGTGYSSLAHLRDLPVAAVKLDRAFIKSIHEDASALAVVRAAIDMAHALGKSVVAEGVELTQQVVLLSQMGCDIMQGYHLSAPVPADQFVALVRQCAAAVPLPLQTHRRR